MVWQFIGIYIINRTLDGHLEMRNFSSHVEKIFHSFAALTPEIFFKTRIEISYVARPCNILYLLNIVLKKIQRKRHHFTERSLTLLLKITHLACNLRISQSTKANNESKILKAYIIQRPFLTGIFLEGLIYRGKFSKSATLILGGNYASQNPLGQLRVQRKFMSVICSKFSP